MSRPTRIPLAKTSAGSREKLPASEGTKSSNLLNYGLASDVGSRRHQRETTKREQETTGSISKENVDLERSKQGLPKPEDQTSVKTAETTTPETNCTPLEYALSSGTQQLNLSQPQLNALSFSLSELADKISPSMHDELYDDENWEPRPRSGSRDHPQCHAGEAASSLPHSKVPYRRKTESRTYVSKQKSFKRTEKNKCSVGGEVDSGITSKVEGENFKGATVEKQYSLESGYNSSMSTSSVSAGDEHKDTDADQDTDVDEAFKSAGSSEGETNTESAMAYTMTLQKKISDVEQRINSLIQGKGASKEKVNGEEDSKNENPENNVNKDDATVVLENEETRKTGSIIENGPVEICTQENRDLNHNVGPNEKDPQNVPDRDLSKSRPFQLSRTRKASADDPPRRGPRPGLVRRRTTLVSFRPPRMSPGFTETNNSEVLEMDETAFVQYLTDVRTMKTLLLKLKRELQEAEVASPLSMSTMTSSSRNPSPLASNTAGSGTSSASGGLTRRMTFDTGEMHEKLRRIRSASFTRRSKQSEGDATPKSSEHAQEKPELVEQDEMKKMKEELEEMKKKVKEISQERDSLVIGKEEVEHELETKNHTIKLLQKQLEKEDNSEEMTYLKRQVKVLTEQVRQQQQKITELRYRTSTPPTTPSAHFNSKKDSVKLDIKNRLRDAFTRHLEESAKSNLLLSKHIEKAELTISDAQKGLKSIYSCTTTTQPHCTAARESPVTDEDDKSPFKIRIPASTPRSPTSTPRSPASTLRSPASTPRSPASTPRSPANTIGFPDSDSRRHSWTANSIEKIIKTWKDSKTQSPATPRRTPRRKTKSSPEQQLNESSSHGNAPHIAFL